MRPRSSTARRTATRARTPPSRRDTPRPRSVAYAANAESIPRRRGDRRPAAVVHVGQGATRHRSLRARPRGARAIDGRIRCERGRGAPGRRRVGAGGAAPVGVVSRAPEVVAWARNLELAIVDDLGSLNGAASAGRAWAIERGL